MRVLLRLALFVTPLLCVATPSPAQDIAEHFKAIVKVSSIVPGDARTAGTLGTERQGSGVLIDNDGLIVTVGYVILEAGSVEIETADRKIYPATILAYDHDTGFGLIKIAKPPDVRPLELGKSGELKQKAPVLAAAFGGAALIDQNGKLVSIGSLILPNAL